MEEIKGKTMLMSHEEYHQDEEIIGKCSNCNGIGLIRTYCSTCIDSGLIYESLNSSNNQEERETEDLDSEIEKLLISKYDH